jgi:hypothetical protein
MFIIIKIYEPTCSRRKNKRVHLLSLRTLFFLLINTAAYGLVIEELAKEEKRS